MKSNKYLILFALLAINSLQTWAQKSFEENKKIEKVFSVGKDALIQVNNKYGNVHVSTWDKDSVAFYIDFIVRANKPERLSKLLSVINFDFDNSPNYVIGQTVINSNSIISDVATMANAMFGGGSNIIINYNVKVPTNCNIKIENKFGNIFLTEIGGNVDVLLSNGDFKSGNIKGDLKLKHSFGNVNLNNIKNGRFILSFSELEMNKANEINITSNSSRVQITEANSIDYISKNDKYYFSVVDNANGKSSFSTINIKKLNQQAIITSSFGNFTLDELSKGFKFFNINSSYTNNILFVSKESAFGIEINSKKTDITLPSEIQNYKKELVDSKTNSYRISALFGANNNPSAKIKVNCNSGNLYLYEK